MTTNFYIKDINSIDSDREQLIYIRYDHRGMKTLISTEDSASIDQMNFITRRGRKKIDISQPIKKIRAGFTSMNTRLKDKLAVVEKAVYEAEKVGDKSPHKVKELYNLLTSKSDSQDESRKDMPIMDAVDFIIEKKRNQLAPNTLKGYGTLKSHLEKFIKSRHNVSKKVWRISQLNRDFYDRFVDYLEEDSGLKGTGSKDNQIKNLKSTAKKLTELEFKVNPLVKDFPRMSIVEEEKIYLYPEELEQIEKVKLTSKHAESQRDLFLLHCEIGVRYGDLKQVTRDRIDLDNRVLIIYVQSKSKKKAQIPLSDKALKLLKKFNYQLPLLSLQKYTDHIKRFCESAKLNRKIQTEAKGEMPLWKYAATHVAKKTFITYALQRGIDILDISLITGTTKEVILKNYAGDRRIQEIVKNWEE
jgi:integrase/uncharacterized protein YfkK (UPF0435 family)